jgi:hypothetical protein
MWLLSTSDDGVWLMVGDTQGPVNSTSNQNANPWSGAGNQRKLRKQRNIHRSGNKNILKELKRNDLEQKHLWKTQEKKYTVKTDWNNVVSRHNDYWTRKSSDNTNTIKNTEVQKTKHKGLQDSFRIMEWNWSQALQV